MGYKSSHGRNRKRKAGRTGRTKLAVKKKLVITGKVPFLILFVG